MATPDELAAAAAAAGGAGGTSTPTVPATGGQPDYKALYEQALNSAEDWKGRSVGFQKAMQDEQKKVEAEATARKAAEDKLKEAEGAKSTLETSHNSTVGELAQLKASHERLDMVLREFPQLIPLLSAKDKDGKPIDVLPTGTGEELRTKLTALAAMTPAQSAGAGAGAGAMSLAGAVPPPPAAPAKKKSQELFESMQALAKDPQKRAEYDKVYSEYLTAKAQEQ